MKNIRGALFGIVGGAINQQLLFGLTALLSIALFGWAVTTSRHSTLDVRFSLAIMTTLLVSYHLFVYDLTIVVLPLLVIIDRMTSGSVRRRRRYEVALVASGALLMMTPVHLVILSYDLSASYLVIPVCILTVLAASTAPFSSRDLTLCSSR